MNSIDTDFLVVGGGIAGPAVAAALARHQYQVILLEKSADPIDTARGDHLQPFTLEILKTWGVYDELIKLGAEKRMGSIWLDQQDNPILDSPVKDLDIPFPYFLYLNHEKIGEGLLSVAARNPHFKMIRPIKNWWRNPDDNTIKVVATDGTEFVVNPKVIVGADGRNSRVRKTWSVDYTSHAYRCPIAVMFGSTGMKNDGNNLKVYLGKDTIVPVIPRTGGGCKVGVAIEKEMVREWRNASSDELSQRVKSLVPCLDLEDLVFADVYPPIHLTASQWVTENVILVGDACHAMHPARSQGMNITIRCVEALVSLLCDEDPNLENIPDILKTYEKMQRPSIDAMLEENHKKGLEFENLEASAITELRHGLGQVQSNPKALLAYSLSAAGY